MNKGPRTTPGSSLREGRPLILVHTAHPQAMEHKGDGFGRLLSPRQFARAEDTALSGIPWAADNDCFQRLDEHLYARMLDTIQGLPGCLFVTAPDVVGDWTTTLARFWKWRGRLHRCGQPVGYVLQDDQPSRCVPWDDMDCLFIGGSTEYKLSAAAERLAREAIERGLWVHMGRVNSRKRFDYARAIGCDSVDGTKFSRFRDRWLPDALKWHRDHLQERIAA